MADASLLDRRFGVPRAEWEDAIRAMLLELRGWAGMFRRMQTHPAEVPAGARYVCCSSSLVRFLIMNQQRALARFLRGAVGALSRERRSRRQSVGLQKQRTIVRSVAEQSAQASRSARRQRQRQRRASPREAHERAGVHRPERRALGAAGGGV